MLDYYSSYPGPTKEAAIQELIKVVGNETKVREIMEKEEIGSWTGWYASHKIIMINRLNDENKSNEPKMENNGNNKAENEKPDKNL